MIFGFNTDVPGKDAVYHVQTEDRGEKNPVIDSIIYVGGKIVDRRRTPYVPSEVTPELLSEMVRKQHRELVEAIRTGTFVPSGTPAASRDGYDVRLLNPTDLSRGDQLQFEVSLAEKGAGALSRGVAVDLRWVLEDRVAESHALQAEADGKVVVSFPRPSARTEAALLIRVNGPLGRTYAKFQVHTAPA